MHREFHIDPESVAERECGGVRSSESSGSEPWSVESSTPGWPPAVSLAFRSRRHHVRRRTIAPCAIHLIGPARSSKSCAVLIASVLRKLFSGDRRPLKFGPGTLRNPQNDSAFGAVRFSLHYRSRSFSYYRVAKPRRSYIGCTNFRRTKKGRGEVTTARSPGTKSLSWTKSPHFYERF